MLGPEHKGRYQWVDLLARVALICTLVCLGLAVVFTVAEAIVEILENGYSMHLGRLILLIVAEIAVSAWVWLLYGLISILVSNEFAVSTSMGRLARIESVLQSQAEAIKEMLDLAQLSDQTKSLIFREREIEAVREAVHEDVMRQDYQTALTLIESMERTSGCADEAQRLREEVDKARKATLDEKIDAAVARVQSMVDRHEWTQVTRAARRLVGLFPNNAKITSLPERIKAARAIHKRGLLQAFDEAVRKNDVDGSIELIRELDQYLSAQEGAALQESARGMFKAKLHNLGVQFAIRVAEQQWAEAVTTGEEIIKEYPNSRMSHEVRAKMDQLRALAATSQES